MNDLDQSTRVTRLRAQVEAVRAQIAALPEPVRERLAAEIEALAHEISSGCTGAGPAGENAYVTLLEQLVQYSPVAVVVLEGPRHEIVFSNPAYQQGVPVDASGQAPWTEETTRQVFHMLDQVYQTAQPYAAQDYPLSMLISGNVETHYYSFNLVPLLRKDGSVSAVMASGSETTPLVRTRQRLVDANIALRQNREHLKMAAEAARVGLWHWYLLSNTLEWDAVCEQVFGHQLQHNADPEVFVKMIHPEDFDRLDEVFNRCIEERGSFEAEFRVIWPDGSVHWISSRGSVALDAQGVPDMLSGVVFDITGQRQLQMELKESEARFRTLADNIPQFAWMADPTGWIFWYNQRWYDYTGTTPEEMEGWGWQKVHHPEYVQKVTEKLRRCFESGTVWDDTFPLRGKDGEYRWFLSRAVPIRDEAGQILLWFGTNTDVTEQLRMEIENRETNTRTEVQRRLLAHRESERQDIAREIHDGPIQSMVSTLFNLKLAREGLSDAAAQAALDETASGLRAAVQELRDVVNELRPPLLVRFGLARSIQMHTEDLRARYPNLKIDLDLVEDEGVLSEETCLSLFRIYQEALNNAVRHAGAGQVWVRYYLLANQAILNIRDDGRGFDASNTDLVALTRGSHFGLAGMKERAEAVGGSLTLESRPGQGTQVTVKVPIGAEKERG